MNKLFDNWFGIVVAFAAGLQYAVVILSGDWTLIAFAFIFTATIYVIFEIYNRRTNYYRRWYLMCRNALELIANDDSLDYSDCPVVAQSMLDRIGPRTSKREDWERAVTK